MKNSYLGFLLFIACSLYSKGQTDISVGQRSKRIAACFKEFHLQHRKIDTAFASSVFLNLMESLDDDKVIFTLEEFNDLKAKSEHLDQEIQSGSSEFFDSFCKVFKAATERSRSVVEKYLGSKPDLFVKNPASLDQDQFPVARLHEEKWKIFLRLEILDEIGDLLEDEDYQIPQPKILDTLILHCQNNLKKRYGDYFKNLAGLDDELEMIYLNAIAESYDIHSSFFSMEEMNSFTEELQSEREIFGINYNKNNSGEFEIIAVIPGSSAWLSGEIHVGDILLSLTFGDMPKQELIGMTRYEASKLFEKAESKELVIELRNKKKEVIKVKLQKSKVYSDEDIIKTAVLNGTKKIGYISLPDFYTNWTDTSALGCANDVAKALLKLKQEYIEGLILDLRDNGGGSLKEAVDLVGIFIDYGPVMVRKDYDGDIWTMKDFNRGAIYRAPLIVLINEGSASASEVVAGALQDYNRALVVGRKSFGKATGQSIMPLDPMIQLDLAEKENPAWGYVKITELGIYRIDLSTNQLNGVRPDVELMLPFEDDYDREKDYPNVLSLDSIQKKTYYTPLKSFAIDHLAKNSMNRQENSQQLNNLRSIYNSADSLFAIVDEYTLDLVSYLDYRKEILKYEEQIDAVYEQKVSNYAPATPSYDEAVYEMSEYMNAYRKDFIESIITDIELSEAFDIMLDLLSE